MLDDSASKELVMMTVIAEDRIGRFAELDQAVVEEVRVLMETGASEAAARRDAGPLHHALGRLHTLLAHLRLCHAS
jgi:hypothetical protein